MNEQSITLSPGQIREIGQAANHTAARKCTHPFVLQEAGGRNSLAMPRRYVDAAKIAYEGVHLE